MRQYFTAFLRSSIEQSIPVYHIATRDTTDRQSDYHASPHQSPCYAAVPTATIISQANSTRYSQTPRNLAPENLRRSHRPSWPEFGRRLALGVSDRGRLSCLNIAGTEAENRSISNLDYSPSSSSSSSGNTSASSMVSNTSSVPKRVTGIYSSVTWMRARLSFW